MSGLERIIVAAKSFGAPGEAVGLLVVEAAGRHGIRVLVGKEVISHVDDARTRDEAIARTLDELRNLEATVRTVDKAS